MALPSEKIQSIIDKIESIKRSIKQSEAPNTSDSLAQFENQLTLDELEHCLQNTESDDLEQNLMTLLSDRWERIRHSGMSYTRQPLNKTNQLCLELATALSPLPDSESEINDLPPNTGPYFLLMPSLKVHQDVYGQNIHNLRLHEFILSDDQQLFIPIEACLSHAFHSDFNGFQHVVGINNTFLTLTPSELQRLSEHSTPVKNYYQAILAYNNRRFLGAGLLSQLTKLRQALRAGGSRAEGTEFNAAAIANEGIVAFNLYWDPLPEEQKNEFYQKYTALRDIIGRLMRPNASNYRNVVYCIEIIAEKLDPIISHLNSTKLQAFEATVNANQSKFISESKKEDYPLFTSKAKAPKILSQILQLDKQQQENLFQDTTNKNVLMFVMENEPETLPEIIELLDDDLQQQAIHGRFTESKTALHIAAKQGDLKSVVALLDLGADIEARNDTGSSALNVASYEGHTEIVTFLLSRSAATNAKGTNANSSLHFAISQGHEAIVDALLEKGATLMLDRNMEGNNALDFARSYKPQLINPVLLKAMELSLDKQQELLRKVPGNYTNILMYAADTMPEHLTPLVNKMSAPDTNPYAINNPLLSKNKNDHTALILAAKAGNSSAVEALLNLGAVITPGVLTWASNEGWTEVVKVLMAHNADSSAKDSSGYTALNYAVMKGHRAVVDVLLANDAPLQSRNSKGENSLDLAMTHHQELIKPLLLKAINLDPKEQEELLSKIAGGIYKNVLSYVCVKHPDLIDEFLLLCHKNNQYKRAQKNMNQFFDFDEHIKPLKTKLAAMKIKAKNDDNYLDVVDKMDHLVHRLELAKVTFLLTKGPVVARKNALRTSCIEAIVEARPVIEQHREWWKVIAKFALALITLPVSVPLYAAGFFSGKTDSAEKLNVLENEIKSLISVK